MAHPKQEPSATQSAMIRRIESTRIYSLASILLLWGLGCLGHIAHTDAGPWDPPESQSSADIRGNEDGKQITEEGEITMIGDGPWHVTFHFDQSGDITVGRNDENDASVPLGQIIRRIDNSQQKPYSYKIVVERTLDPLLDNFDAYEAAQSDLHEAIDFEKIREKIAKEWDRRYDDKLKEAKRYLADHNIRFQRLSDEEIRTRYTRMETYEKKRADIVRNFDKLRNREKDWKIKANTPRIATHILVEQYVELRALELIKERLTQEYGDSWKNKVGSYFDRLGVTTPDTEKKILQVVDAIQIGINGRFAASLRNKKQFNASLTQKQKQSILEHLTFPWRFSMWPFAHPADPNSWIKNASPVPAGLQHPTKVNLVIRGTLNPKQDDNADWWEVADIDETRLTIQFDGQRKAQMVGPLQHRVVGETQKRSLIRVVTDGDVPVKYKITIRSNAHDHDKNKSTLIYEPVKTHPTYPY